MKNYLLGIFTGVALYWAASSTYELTRQVKEQGDELRLIEKYMVGSLGR